MAGRCNFSSFFFFDLLIRRPESGVDIGSVGLVETRVFLFFTPYMKETYQVPFQRIKNTSLKN